MTVLLQHLIDARPRQIAPGLAVGRALPTRACRSVGPFLFLDHMGPTQSRDVSVLPHPHIHLATVTYLFEGQMVHRDSVGSVQTIVPGEVNWMTAGRGIVHSERPATSSAPTGLHGLQLWVGLPRDHEDVAPSFQHADRQDLPELQSEGKSVRVLLGHGFSLQSPVVVSSPLFCFDVRLKAGAELAVPNDFPERAAYVVDGTLSARGSHSASAATDAVASADVVGSQPTDPSISPRQLAVFTHGAEVVLRAEHDARLVLLGGEPLDGPRAMWWNFVSSSKERIVQAAEDWRQGRFPKIPGDDVEFVPAPDGPRFARS